MESNSQNSSESWGQQYLEKVKSVLPGQRKIDAIEVPDALVKLVRPTPEFQINRYVQQYPQFAPRFYVINPRDGRQDERLRGHWETEILDPGALWPMVFPKEKEPSFRVGGRYYRDWIGTAHNDGGGKLVGGALMWFAGGAYGVIKHFALDWRKRRNSPFREAWEMPARGQGPTHLSPKAIRYNAQATIGVKMDGSDPTSMKYTAMDRRLRKMLWKKSRVTKKIWKHANYFLMIFIGYHVCAFLTKRVIHYLPYKNPVTKTEPFRLFVNFSLLGLIWAAATPAAVPLELRRGYHKRIRRRAQSYGNLFKRMCLVTLFSGTLALGVHHRNLTVGRAGFGTFDRPRWSWDLESKTDFDRNG